MKEPYRKGVANHPDPESCAGDGNIPGEALTGAHAGQPLSSEITFSACRPCPTRGRPHQERRQAQAAPGRRGVRDPAHAWKLYAREPGDPGNSLAVAARDGPKRLVAVHRTCTFPGSRTVP